MSVSTVARARPLSPLAGWLSQAMVFFQRLALRHATSLALGLAAILVLGDYATGIELAFTLLYLVPISIAAWLRGRAVGIAVAALCSAGSLGVEITERLHRHWPFHPFHMFWNHGGTFALFFLCVLVCVRLREYFEKEQRERRLTLEQLRQAERLGTLGKLGAGLAHELGTPLNVIAGYAELIAAERLQHKMVKAAASTIVAQTEKMTVIIRGLLDFSRPSGLQKSNVAIAPLIRDAAKLVMPIARKKGIGIVVDTTRCAETVVFGNRTELEQVLVNLLVNGIQAMNQAGSLRLRGHAPNGHAKDNLACLEVEDEGEGIAPESLSRIFDPFFTTKDVGEGTGLGLSISYGIVSDHGGHITVSSKVGIGSRFSVYLPLANE